MKKCPYCAEEIQDEAIKCRYCFSDLTVSRDEALGQRPEPAKATPVPASTAASTSGSTPAPTASSTSASTTPKPASEPAAPAEAPATAVAGQATPWDAGKKKEEEAPKQEPPKQEASEAPKEEPKRPEPASPQLPAVTAPGADSPVSSVHYSHSGYRYVLGYGPDYFGIWDRQSPTVPSERFPRTDIGWRDAWLRFVALEPKHVEVPQGGMPEAAPTTSTPGDDDVMQYTHSGTRYLLGYGASFFGIWDRQNPAAPVERFPRTDEGWAQAWRRYTQIESHFAEVGKS